ncbi:MAG: hypothetical protein SW127_19355, partial [Actinomycetota bacterium]|nr:hypothetical protein [Actinomycetota bacterium]
ARAMHFVGITFVKIGETDGLPDAAMRIYWAGHEFLRNEHVRVYGSDEELGREDDEYSELGRLFAEIEPDWRPIDPPKGAFSIEAGMQLRLPNPFPNSLRLLTLKFGKQSTQLVRVDNLPLIGSRRMAVSVFRQGVSFWFDEITPNRVGFDWGESKDIIPGPPDAQDGTTSR